jgi:NADH dehydrogenase
LPTGRGGRIVTGADLRVAGQERIFAAGDIALIDGDPLPQLAQPAIQQGRHAAEQIKRLVAGEPTRSGSDRTGGRAVQFTPCRRFTRPGAPPHNR